MTVHALPIQIYYEDTDAGGVVYYANYLKFAERGRTEFLRMMGFESSRLAESEGVLILVKNVEIDYIKSAKLDDKLTLSTHVEEVGKTSLVMIQEVSRESALLCTMRIVVVCVGKNGRPARWPDRLHKAFKDHSCERDPV